MARVLQVWNSEQKCPKGGIHEDPEAIAEPGRGRGGHGLGGPKPGGWAGVWWVRRRGSRVAGPRGGTGVAQRRRGEDLLPGLGKLICRDLPHRYERERSHDLPLVSPGKSLCRGGQGLSGSLSRLIVLECGRRSRSRVFLHRRVPDALRFQEFRLFPFRRRLGPEYGGPPGLWGSLSCHGRLRGRVDPGLGICRVWPGFHVLQRRSTLRLSPFSVLRLSWISTLLQLEPLSLYLHRFQGGDLQ